MSRFETSAKEIPAGVNYILGGSAGMAGMFLVYPFDLVKTRMQVSEASMKAKEYKTSFHVFYSVIKNEGFLGLSKGMGAALLRQATYTTARLGVYNNLLQLYRENYQEQPSLSTLLVIGMMAGICGAFVGNPADVVLIRMAADGRLPHAERRNYGNVVRALYRIPIEEGPLALLKGVFPTMGRAIIINMCQLGTYSYFKNLLKADPFRLTEGILLHFDASMLAGILVTIASLPLDIAKTRIQNQKDAKYKDTPHVMGHIIKNEGFFALWKGLTPYYLRLGPHTVLTLMFYEQFKNLYRFYTSPPKAGL